MHYNWRIFLGVCLWGPLGQLEAQAAPGNPRNSSQCEAETAKSRLFRIVETTNTGKKYLLEGGEGWRGREAPIESLANQESRTVDPRSTLVIEFANAMDACVPAFAMVLKARATSGSSDRALEIPYYYVTGAAAPSQKVAFSSSPQRAVRLFEALHLELGRLLAELNRVDSSSSSSATDTPQDDRQRKIQREIAVLEGQVSQKRSELSAKRDALEQSVLQPMSADSQKVTEKNFQLQSGIRQLELELATAQGEIVVRSLEAQMLDAQNRNQAKLLASRLSGLPVLDAVVREFSDAGNGMIKRLASNLVSRGTLVDETVVRALISSIERSLNSIRELDKKFADSSQVSDQDLTRLGRLTASLVRDANALRLMQAKNGSSMNERQQELNIPAAYIDLPKNAVKEGDRIVIELTIKDDTTVTEFWSSELQTRKQGFVRNIRDVALFIDRQRRGRTTISGVAKDLAGGYEKLLALDAFNRLEYDLLPTSREIAGGERYFPAPGVVLEGHIRPRLLQAKRRPCDGSYKTLKQWTCKSQDAGSMLANSTLRFVRNLDVSIGLSVSVVGFSTQTVAISPPNAGDFSKLWEKDPETRLSAFRETTTLGTQLQSTTNIDVAPAAHIGLFDGAVSIAYGLALRAPGKNSFVAVGFSFLGLTEGGGKLIGEILKQ